MTLADAPAYPEARLTTIDNASWELYERLVQERDASGKHFKITYYDGRLVIGMPPLPIHEKLKGMLGWLVETSAAHREIPLASYGSTTWRRGRRAGMESDECFYVGREPDFDPSKPVDLSREPAPDLAIEVDVTHRPPERLPAYARLGVKEVWRFGGRTIEILYRDPAGDEFEPSEVSRILPFIKAEDLNRFITILASAGESAARRAILEWLRSLPRGKS